MPKYERPKSALPRKRSRDYEEPQGDVSRTTAAETDQDSYQITWKNVELESESETRAKRAHMELVLSINGHEEDPLLL